LQQNLAHLRAEVEKQLPKAKMFDHRATYLAWIDLTDYELAKPQAEILRHGVALVPGEDHAPGDEYSNFVRFNFACSKERITEAVRRMRLALEGGN
jgi:cystathionine beta-lyase